MTNLDKEVADLRGIDGCASPLYPIFKTFMQLSATIMPNNRLAPRWEILDPPLERSQQMIICASGYRSNYETVADPETRNAGCQET